MSKTQVSTRPATSKRKVSLETLIDERKQVYVRNLLKGGIISLVCYDPFGKKPTRIIIPRTKHPFNISDLATPQAIQASSDLRMAISRGALELLDPVAAEKELEKPGVLQELKAAQQRIEQHSTATNAYRSKRDLADPGSVIAMTGNGIPMQTGPMVDPRADIESEDNPEDDFDTLAGVEKVREDSGIGDVNSRLRNNLSLLFEGEMNGREVRTDLADVIEDLSNEDLEFAINQCSGKDIPEKVIKEAKLVRDWAENALAERRGTMPAYEAD